MSGSKELPPTQNDDKRILDQLLRHVVTFTGAYVLRSKPSEERHFNYSCFLITIFDQWFLVTAGHILQVLDPAIESGELAFTGRVLADFYGDGASHRDPIPFDYASHKKIHVYDENLDFALIALSFLEVEQLKANGRVPFVFEGKPERPWNAYDGFAILGFPDEDVDSDVKSSRTGPVTVGVRPGLAPVRIPTTLPSNIKKPTAAWFVGELLDKSDPVSIVGMSGGPIVGFKKNGENLDYWIIAIQSGWFDGPRIIVGCPLPIVLGVLRAAVRGVANGNSERSAAT